jgi:hypothetical protein
MLEAFTSVGAERFDLTLTDLEGQKLRFRKGLTSPELGRQLPRLLAEATPRMHNVIIRPHATAATLIQLDDLAVAAIERVLPVAFLTHETSPGNHQAWVAVSAGADADFARRLRKGAGADPTASGATRIAGSLNFKPKYAPDFPRVEIRHLVPRRVSRTDELQALGLVAAPEAAPVPSSRVSQARKGRRAWPSYERCLEGAPLNHGGTGPDTSRADFTWAMTAIDWGWSEEETAGRLLELSSKARENGERYATATVQNATAAVARRQGRG